MKQFFDFPNWPGIKNDMIRSVARRSGHPEGPVQKGEILNVNFTGVNSQVTVLVRLPADPALRLAGQLMFSH